MFIAKDIKFCTYNLRSIMTAQLYVLHEQKGLND